MVKGGTSRMRRELSLSYSSIRVGGYVIGTASILIHHVSRGQMVRQSPKRQRRAAGR
jgi:hypothetical protein